MCVCGFRCVHMREWVSSAEMQPPSVFRYDCLVCIISELCARLPANPPVYEKAPLQTKKSFISASNTCTDVYKTVIHMPEGELLVSPINCCVFPPNPIWVMTVAHEDFLTVWRGWSTHQKQPAATLILTPHTMDQIKIIHSEQVRLESSSLLKIKHAL